MRTVLIFKTTKLKCWQSKFEGILEFAKQHGWQLQVVDSSVNISQVSKLLTFWNAAGCIVDADGGNSDLRPENFSTTPVVFLDHTPDIILEGASVVRHDSAKIAYVAAKELLRLGFDDYGVVGWFSRHYWLVDKLEGFRSILELHGKKIHVFEPEVDDRYASLPLQKRLRVWMQSLPKPCGIFGVNDYIAERAISAASALGYAIPEELAFVGADNDELICETTRPTLTSVLPDFKLTGYKAAQLLAAKIDTPESPAVLEVVSPLRLIRRQSTRLLKRSDHDVQSAMELIRREAVNGLRARDVIRTFACSRRQAEIRFRNLVGKTILQEIQAERFERTLKLLENPNIELSAIPGLSGWPSELVLRRYVKSKTGKTLSELRKHVYRYRE